MRVLQAILKDFKVVFGSLFLTSPASEETPQAGHKATIEVVSVEAKLEDTQSVVPYDAESHALRTNVAETPSVPTKTDAQQVVQPKRQLNILTDECYVAIPNAVLVHQPLLTFDGTLARIPFATRLTIEEAKGRWYRVRYGDLEGWIEKELVSLQKNEVVPSFSSNRYYGSENVETIKLRTHLKDECGGNELSLPLTDVEYVLYSLRLSGRHILWPEVRPRSAGSWHHLLKGIPGIQIGVRPKTGAVIEYSSGIYPHIGIIDAVYSDESILVKGVREGVYYEKKVKEEVWKKDAPVFIAIS